MSVKSLEHFFYAKSIAVVGASNDASKTGYQVVHNLDSRGYQGTIYPVNPKEKEIAGLPCYSSIMEIKEPLELVVITVPAKFVLPVVDQAIERGDVKGLVVISAGFREVKTPRGD